MAQAINVLTLTPYSIFKEYFPPSRIHKAEKTKNCLQFIKTTDLPVNKLAKKFDIPDYNYFSTIFRSVFGMSPREFRKSQALKKKKVNYNSF